MRWRIERFSFALIAGWLLTFHGDRLGPDLFALPAADPYQAAAKRALVLLVCGALIAIPLVRAPLLALGGLVAGFVLGRLVAGWPGSSSAWTLAPIALLGLLALVQMRRLAPTLFETRDPHEELPVNIGELLCYAIAGGGAALALEAVARHVKLFSAGVARDEQASDAVFLALTWLGAAAFGWVARSNPLRKLAFPVLFAGVAAACYVSLEVVESIHDGYHLDKFVRRFGCDTSWHGTLWFDALVATAVYVAPAFVLGAALCATRSRASLFAALVGASIAIATLPWLLHRDPAAPATIAETFSAHFVVVGTIAAAIGAALGAVFDTRRSGLARIVAIACAFACAVPTLTIKAEPIFVLSPWMQRPVLPFVVFETPNGLATVEPAKGNFKQATLDRRALTTDVPALAADVQRIHVSCELLAPEKRIKGQLRVLWIGQLSVVRASVLQSSGATSIDRSATWWPAMARLEKELFAPDAPPAGDVLPPSVARARLASGGYDLVLVPPVPGDLPSFGDVDAPPGTLVVRWFGIDEPAGDDDAPASTFFENGARIERPAVVLASSGFEGVSFGVVTNGWLAGADDPQRPVVADLDPEPAMARPLALLLERKVFRNDKCRARWIDALARGARGTRHEILLESMRLFFAAQAPSSPWETAAQQIELPDAALVTLASGSRTPALDTATREAWEWIARVLVGKRDVQRIDRFLKPLADANAPWPVLEWALARADLEALEPQEAARRMRPLGTPAERRVEIWFTLAEAEELCGDLEAAARAWRRAHELAPSNEEVERRLAMALARTRDPEAQGLIQKILTAHPSDEELRRFAGEGPYPAPRYVPGGGAHE